MENPKSPYDRNVNQPQDTSQPKRSGPQETWPAKEKDVAGIPPGNDVGQGHGQSAPNLRDRGTGSGDQKGGESRVGRSGGLDRNQDLNKENREGELPKSESDVLDEPPFDSRMPGEPPRGADNTAPDGN